MTNSYFLVHSYASNIYTVEVMWKYYNFPNQVLPQIVHTRVMAPAGML